MDGMLFRPVRVDGDRVQFRVPAHSDSPPQAEAAEMVRPQAGAQARKILRALSAGPMTQEEIAMMTGLRRSSVCGRVNEMERMGLVAKVLDGDGRPLRRRASSGVRVYVYRAVPDEERRR